MIVKRVTQVALTRTTEPTRSDHTSYPDTELWRVEWKELRNGKPTELRQSHYTEAAARRHVDGLLAMLADGANTRLPGNGRPVTFKPQAHDQTGVLPVPATTVIAPPWIADLPMEDRGFHLPAEVGWVDGKPRIDQNDPMRSFCLMIGKACAVCGHPLEPGGLVYRVWGDHDAKHIRDAERDRSHDDAGPVHWSCIVYSAMVCPHMSSDRSRLSKGNTMNPGFERGREAVIIGFQQTGILFPTRPTAGPGPQPMGIFNGLKKYWPYKNGRELENLYAKAVEHDTGFIDASQPRLFWTDSEDDVADLQQRFAKGQQQLSKRTPDYRINVQRTAPGSPNAGLYSAYLL